MGSISIVHWAAVLLIVILVFGTKKLGSIGTDLGKAVKGFKDGVKGDDVPTQSERAPAQLHGHLNQVVADAGIVETAKIQPADKAYIVD